LPDAAQDARPIAVVVGASGGLGRAIAQEMSADSACEHVVALSRRRPDDWEDDARRSWAAVDILDEDSLAAGARLVATLGTPIRIVVATGRLSAHGLQPEKSMRALDAQALGELFAVNAIGPALAAKHLLPLTPRDRPSLFAAISARVGSIGDNRLGGWHGYRASKAALNMLVRTLAIEHRRSRPLGVCVALHPGTVKTTLSAPFQAGVPEEKLFSPERSAAALMRVMKGLGPDDTGGFFAWDGAKIPW
jgi:NAD(P)-dependent dehydrogenase (short-subunit alcohol dehydrogenase family)